MSGAGYIGLARQSGLLREMQSVANNIANISTTGFRKEGVVFAEFVSDTGGDSVSIATALGRKTDPSQGMLKSTAGRFDFAIEGEGFFQVLTPDGPRLTRAGAFMPNAENILVNPEGFALLDNGEAPIFIPPNTRGIALAPDGTLSADGVPLAEVGVVLPVDEKTVTRSAGTLFQSPDGVVPVLIPSILQGYLESSNVDPVTEMTRMIEIQRGYELGQKFLDREDERIRTVIRTLGQK